MQGVLFSWILVGELNAESEWVGIAQTASMLPSLMLLLIGGAAADRFDPRRLLIALHLLAPLPVLMLAFAAAQGVLSIPLVIAFAISMGTLTAFGNPAREAILGRVVGEDLMNAVASMTAVQFTSQALGSIIAGLARVIGSPMTLCLHALVLLAGAFFAYPLPPSSPRATTPNAQPGSRGGLRSTLASIGEGLRIVAKSSELRGTLTAVFAVGVFFVGPFTVVLPLMVRDFYGGQVDQLALAMTLFPLGTITGSLILRALGLRRKGRAMLVALLFAASLQASMGSGLPFWAFSIAAFGWGLGGAFFINASRTIFQEHAPAAYRGRVLAVYQLGFTGGGPIGAFASGFAISAWGLGATFFIGASSMALMVIGMATLTRVGRIE